MFGGFSVRTVRREKPAWLKEKGLIVCGAQKTRKAKTRTETNGSCEKAGLQVYETKAGDGDRTRDVQLGKMDVDQM